METQMTSVVTLPLIVLLAAPLTDGAVASAINAEQLYAKAREVDADDPFREHHEMAVKAWTAFVATDAPPHEKRDAYLRLAESQMALQDAASALESIEHAIQLGAVTAKAHCLRGMILVAQGSREAALGAIQRALEIDPSYARAYLVRAKLALDEAPQKASEDIQKAIELDPDDPLCYHYRAMWHVAAGRDADTVKDFDRYLRMQPGPINLSDSKAHIFKGAMLSRLGDQNGALANALFTRRLNPDSESAANLICAASFAADYYTVRTMCATGC